MKYLFLISVLIICILPDTVFPQIRSNEPIKILNADVMEGMGNIREYRGNVRLQHGNVLANSDTAYQYFEYNRAELKGRAVIIQADMTLKSPYVTYEGNSGIATAEKHINIVDSNTTLDADKGNYITNTFIADFNGNVRIKDQEVTITSDKAKYNRKTLESNAWGNVLVDDDSAAIFSDILYYHRRTKESRNYGNVVIKGKYNNVYLTGDTLLNYPQKKYTYSSGNPILFQIDSTDNEGDFVYDTLSISCDTMQAYREDEEEKYFFNGNVEIVRGNLYAKSKNAVFFKTSELFFLEGNPIVWFDSTQLHADSMIIYIPDNKLKMIHAFGNALAVSRDDTLEPERKNQIIGFTVKIYFSDDKIDRIESFGDAKSLYFMASDAGNDGADRTSCDSIYIYFEDNKPLNVVWLGAVEGEYFPEKMVWQKVKDYFLPNYRWADMKPRKKNLHLRENH